MSINLIEFIGFLSFLILGWGLFHKNDIHTKYLIVISCLIGGLYFTLLGLYISALMMVFSSVRIITSIYTRSTFVGIFFILFSASTPFWIESVDWIAALTGVTGTIGLFWCTRQYFRFVLLVTTFIWIVNAFVYGAWVAFIGECFVFTVGLIRLIIMINEENDKYNYR